MLCRWLGTPIAAFRHQLEDLTHERRATAKRQTIPSGHWRLDRPAFVLFTIRRYAAASVGPIAAAGAQFLLSVMMLQLLPPRDFGIFSFLLVISQLSWGLWSALFCAPLPVIVHAEDSGRRARATGALLSANLICAAVAVPVFGLLAWSFRAPAEILVLFGLYGGIALLRWFARAHAYVIDEVRRTIASDIVYAAVLLIGGTAIYVSGHASLMQAYGLLLLSVLLAMLPFGTSMLKRHLDVTSLAAVRDYPRIWKRHSSWALLGVTSSEATGNAHAYIVTAFAGPAQFAPLAASILLTRPISVAMNALGEWERPRMAAAVADNRMNDVRRAVSHFRLALGAAWVATFAAAAAVLAFAPWLVFPAQYDLNFVSQAGLLWMLVALVRLMRTPEATVLQASGQFRPLAMVGLYSATVSIVGVTFMLWAGGLLWSIVGILLGELLCAFGIWRLYAQALAPSTWKGRDVARH